MGFPRSKYVQEGKEGVYHCYCRCVRGAYLCGYDRLTGRDYSHRRVWIITRIRFLADIFAIEVCSYAVMETHYHTKLRLRPDIVATWSDREVARRWLTLFPGRRRLKGDAPPPTEEKITALANCPERIAVLRKRLCSLSWFMGRLNEYIARKANKEDGVKGRFWESRFKCQALLDEAAVLACMVYIDLNPIRAGMAATPEESDFTSIQERIRLWQKEAASGDPSGTAGSSSWLCPISPDPERRGILSMTEAEYFNLVDRSGRMIRSDKRGAIDADLAPILLRIGARPDAWIDTVSGFGSKFHLAAGLLENMRKFANQIGSRWIQGAASARVAFASSPSKIA